jgi:hypothetical protein
MPQCEHRFDALYSVQSVRILCFCSCDFCMRSARLRKYQSFEYFFCFILRSAAFLMGNYNFFLQYNALAKEYCTSGT